MANPFPHRIAVLWLSTLAVAIQAQAAQEPWTLVRSEPSAAYYLDMRNVHQQGTYLVYRVLVDFNYGPRHDEAELYKSLQLIRYANCATREQDTKSLLQYHAPMGRGEPTWILTFEDATLRMESVEPGSVSAQLLDIACSLKE